MRTLLCLVVAVCVPPAAALSASDAPQTERVIEGRVITSEGHPLPGVLVRATPTWLTSYEPDREVSVGVPEYETVDVIKERAADRALRVRRQRRDTSTDETGHYRIEGLGERSYLVEALADGWRIKGVVTLPGSHRHFTAHRVVGQSVDILLPDGTRPPDPLKIYHRTTADSPARSYLWRPERSTIYMPPGSGVVQVTAGLHDQYRSRDTPVDLTAGEEPPPLTLTLNERTSLIGRVIYPAGARSWGGDVFLSPWPEGEERPALDALLRREDIGLRQNQKVLGARSAARDWYVFHDLAPGRYVLAYALVNQPQDENDLASIREIEIRGGVNEVHLEVDEKLLGDTLDIRIEDPDGGEVPDAKVQLRHMKTERSMETVPAKVARLDPATWRMWVLSPRQRTWLADQPRPSVNGPATYTVRASSDRFGTVLSDWTTGDPQPLLIRFENTVKVIATLENYADSGLAGHVKLGLSSVLIPSPGPLQTHMYRLDVGLLAPDASGVAEFSNVAPGDYDLGLYVEGDDRKFAAFRAVRLTADEEINHHRMMIPEFYTLDVEVPEARSSQSFWLRPEAEHAFKIPRRVSPVAGHVVFPRVLKGSYTLEGPGGRMRLEVDTHVETKFEPTPPRRRRIPAPSS